MPFNRFMKACATAWLALACHAPAIAANAMTLCGAVTGGHQEQGSATSAPALAAIGDVLSLYGLPGAWRREPLTSLDNAVPPPWTRLNEPHKGWALSVSYSLSFLFSHDPIDLMGYRWTVDLYEHWIHAKTCRPEGGCTSRSVTDTGWRLVPGHTDYFAFDNLYYCAHVSPLPAQIRLEGGSIRRHSDQPQVFAMQAWVTRNARPVPGVRVFLQGPAGLQCSGTGCSNLVSDAHGRVEFRYVAPADPQGHRATLTAHCDACDHSADAQVEVKPKPATVIGFFNGVANTERAAVSSLQRLELEYGQAYHDTPLIYEAFYNQTACGQGLGRVSCLEDLAEVFQQRSRELDGVLASRWEVFWDLLAGRHRQPDSFAHPLRGLLGNAANALAQLIDATFNAMLNQLGRTVLDLLTLFTDAPTAAHQAAHRQQLAAHAAQDRRLLLVAHSQGNLFANNAHDAVRAAHAATPVAVVHVAPASPTLRGGHLLANIDMVINGLRMTGVNSVPPVNAVLMPSAADPSGHGFEPTYLDKQRAGHALTRGLIDTALATLDP